jgi:hypothetical protein
MRKDEWLTPEQANLLLQQGAPMKLIRALGMFPRLRHSLTSFDYTERYGVLVDMVQRRSKRLAQRAVFDLAEALTPRLGQPRAVRDYTGAKILCREWKVPGWALSVSAEFYSGDSDWCETAIVVHRRFQDEQAQKLMDRQVKIALWGEDDDAWPQPHYFTPPPIVFDEPKPLPEWIIELQQIAGTADHAASGAEADLCAARKGNQERPSLQGFFDDEPTP